MLGLPFADELVDTPLYDAFISYAHEDIEWARWLYEGLSSRGLAVFLDEAVLHYGDIIPARLEECLEHSITVLLLLSRKSRDSAWVKFESSFHWSSTFIEGKRRLVPVLIEDGIEVPTRLKSLRACKLADKDDNKLQHLVDDLLSRSDIEIGPYRLDRDQAVPQELISSIARAVERYTQSSPQSVPLIETAIVELVDNAFRHPTEGPVTLDVKLARGFVEIVVHDEGNGFELRDTLLRLRGQVHEDPTTVGGRGLTLLEAKGVGLSNGSDANGEHWVKATIWPDTPVVVRRNSCVTISPGGRLDHRFAESLKVIGAVNEHDSTIRGFVLDLANVAHISSIGLRALMLLARAERGRRDVVVAGVQPSVAEIFSISRYDRVLAVYPTRADAEAAVDAGTVPPRQ